MKCALKCCEKNNNGMCSHCGKKETVYHFLIECIKYNELRDYFLLCVEEICENYNVNLTLENILFPPRVISWYHRKMILDSICTYIRRSRRLLIKS